MTREQAKREIDSLDYYLQNHTDDYGEESHTAMMMAIKSLAQKPCEDAISREEAIDACNQSVNILEATDRIKDLPPVTPKAKTGHWIGHKQHCENLGVIPSGLGSYKWCSNCDCGIDVSEWHRNHYNYCPSCGAKMESEDE